MPHKGIFVTPSKRKIKAINYTLSPVKMSSPKIIRRASQVMLLLLFLNSEIMPASCDHAIPASSGGYYPHYPESYNYQQHYQKSSRSQHYSAESASDRDNSFTPRQHDNRERQYEVAGKEMSHMGHEVTNGAEVWERRSAGPSFDMSPPRNVTALKDANAYLHCIVYNLANKTLSWIREKDLHILTVGKVTYTADNRFEVIHKDHSNSWTLKINSVQPRDSGRYECQVNSHATDPITFEVDLAVFVPTAHIVGSTERFVDRGSTINLTCIINHNPDPASSTFWYHNNRIINYDSPGSRVSVITDRGTSTKTILLIHDASNTASGTYSCAPSPSAAASVKIHILNGETPAAMQTNNANSHTRRETKDFFLLHALSFCTTLAAFFLVLPRHVGLENEFPGLSSNDTGKQYLKCPGTLLKTAHSHFQEFFNSADNSRTFGTDRKHSSNDCADVSPP
ncbi:uncharacterized protein LOC108675226 isoform X2 [Hyalella azteca]|uniref:Uncharacterized protein LOC108675226 isoform X2 n=1 Tax=Hyalella azteca TaxID=294128 RepID=A0A8B7NY61_HYAAZ|nr:uncharacterized protein LOC108675226 isoform X2 [Hyalella azteca]